MTLFTSDINKKDGKTAFRYLLVSLFLALFGAVYELFSHEVYSYSMIYAFLLPLAGGALPFLFLALKGRERNPAAVPRLLYHSGIAVFTTGLLLNGVLEIYGTTNTLLKYYWIAGALLLSASLFFRLLRLLPAFSEKKRRIT